MSGFASSLLVALGVAVLGIVSISACQSGQAAYYLAEYYSDDELGKGFFYGKGAEALGLTGEVNEEAARALFRREHPETGLPLAENQVRPHHAKSKNPRVGVDCVFSLGETYNVVYGLAPREEAHKIVHEVVVPAIKAAIDDYERNRAVCRRGRGGHIKEPARLITMVWVHETNRNGQPLLHLHCFVSGAAVRLDGSTGALDQRETYRAQRRMSSVFHREVDRGFERLGYALERCPRNPWANRIAGVPDELCKALVGGRQQEVLDAALRAGRTDAAARELATRKTRKPKDDLSRAERREGWAEVGREHGFSAEKLKSIALDRSVSPDTPSPVMQAGRRVRTQQVSERRDYGLAKTSIEGEELVRLARDLENSAPKHPLSKKARRDADDAIREISSRRGLAIVTGDNREQLMNDTARAYVRSGYRVLAVTATKDQAKELRKTMPASEHLSAGQLAFRERFGVREQIRYSLSFAGLKHAIDPWAWSRPGHRMIHNRNWGIKPRLRVDRKTAILVRDADQLSDSRLGDLLDLAHRKGAKLILSTEQTRSSLSMLTEEVGAIVRLEREQRRGLGRTL